MKMNLTQFVVAVPPLFLVIFLFILRSIIAIQVCLVNFLFTMKCSECNRWRVIWLYCLCVCVVVCKSNAIFIWNNLFSILCYCWLHVIRMMTHIFIIQPKHMISWFVSIIFLNSINTNNLCGRNCIAYTEHTKMTILENGASIY